MELAVHAEGLRKRFGDVQALDGVDLSVPAGTVCALLGPNGAGKTTTVRVLTTLLRADAGTASVAGFDVVRQAAMVRASIGLAGQQATVDPLQTGRGNLVMVGRLYHLPARVARDRAQELLERFSLTDAADRLARTYSGGMRRRLDLATALVAAPPVLVLDEPTTGLDPHARAETWEVISDLVRGGTTLVLTTQYLEEADRLADQIVVIDHGVVVASGTGAELKDQVGGRRLQLVVQDPGLLDRAAALVEQATGAVPGIDHDQLRVTVAAPDGPRTVAAVANALVEAGIDVDDIGLFRPSLDEVFLQLTGAPGALA